MNKSAWLFAGLMAAGPALAAEVDYHTDIRPIMEKYCVGCHGPRMDGYETLIFYIAWPDTGALMRRLDDGKHTKDGKPGNMYERLGNSDEERQKNLALIKAWVGEDAWILKRKDDITKEELLKIKAKY